MSKHLELFPQHAPANILIRDGEHGPAIERSKQRIDYVVVPRVGHILKRLVKQFYSRVAFSLIRYELPANITDRHFDGHA